MDVGVKFQRFFYKENHVCQPLTPWGDGCMVFKSQNIFPQNWMKYADLQRKIMFAYLHPVGGVQVSDQFPKQCSLLQTEWHVQICIQRSCLLPSTPNTVGMVVKFNFFFLSFFFFIFAWKYADQHREVKVGKLYPLHREVDNWGQFPENKVFLLGITWNDVICTEMPWFLASNPMEWGVRGKVTNKVLLENELNVQVYTENSCLRISASMGRVYVKGFIPKNWTKCADSHRNVCQCPPPWRWRDVLGNFEKMS